jgi:hypothetical protein
MASLRRGGENWNAWNSRPWQHLRFFTDEAESALDACICCQVLDAGCIFQDGNSSSDAIWVWNTRYGFQEKIKSVHCSNGFIGDQRRPSISEKQAL